MVDKSNPVDIAFRKVAGMDMQSAFRVLMKKGITSDEMADKAVALFHSIIEDIDKRELDDNYKTLLHLVLSYYIFNGAIIAFDDWIKKAASEHNMKPDKYIKIIFNL